MFSRSRLFQSGPKRCRSGIRRAMNKTYPNTNCSAQRSYNGIANSKTECAKKDRKSPRTPWPTPGALSLDVGMAWKICRAFCHSSASLYRASARNREQRRVVLPNTESTSASLLRRLVVSGRCLPKQNRWVCSRAVVRSCSGLLQGNKVSAWPFRYQGGSLQSSNRRAWTNIRKCTSESARINKLAQSSQKLGIASLGPSQLCLTNRLLICHPKNPSENSRLQ